MKSIIVLLLALDFLASPLACLSAEPKGAFSRVPLPVGLVEPETAAGVAALVCFLEGPAVDDQGNVFFSDITSNRILKMDFPR